MITAPETKTCVSCQEPRLLSQFRSRAGGRKQSVCRRCSKLATRQARRLERLAKEAAK